jgi:hypothetical protein
VKTSPDHVHRAPAELDGVATSRPRRCISVGANEISSGAAGDAARAAGGRPKRPLRSVSANTATARSLDRVTVLTMRVACDDAGVVSPCRDRVGRHVGGADAHRVGVERLGR